MISSPLGFNDKLIGPDLLASDYDLDVLEAYDGS